MFIILILPFTFAANSPTAIYDVPSASSLPFLMFSFTGIFPLLFVSLILTISYHILLDFLLCLALFTILFYSFVILYQFLPFYTFLVLSFIFILNILRNCFWCFVYYFVAFSEVYCIKVFCSFSFHLLVPFPTMSSFFLLAIILPYSSVLLCLLRFSVYLHHTDTSFYVHCKFSLSCFGVSSLIFQCLTMLIFFVPYPFTSSCSFSSYCLICPPLIHKYELTLVNFHNFVLLCLWLLY